MIDLRKSPTLFRDKKHHFQNDLYSWDLLGKKYKRNKGVVNLEVGDEVIIHPIHGISQATISYPAKVVVKEWVIEPYDSTRNPFPGKVLCVEGIGWNSGWCGAVINGYCFNRLEFVKRGDQ